MGISRRYWLFKSEPDVYSIGDLKAAPKQTTCWDGVRNYQARNLLRDEVRKGDQVLFYHSQAKPLAVVGTTEVVRDGYPDHTAFDANGPHFDARSNSDNPVWYMVDIRLINVFPEPVTLESIRLCKKLAEMALLQRGSRLSIQPVTASEWVAVHQLAGVPPS